MSYNENSKFSSCFGKIQDSSFNVLDLIPRRTTVEKIIELFLAGVPEGPAAATELLAGLTATIEQVSLKDVRVLVFGGGTGLSTIIGGDSRHPEWPQAPFAGLKDLFPQCRAVVCVTDDGGSTGELLKDLPLIGLGDLRHVLLSALCRQNLQKIYSLGDRACVDLVKTLHQLFNFRFSNSPNRVDDLLDDLAIDLQALPGFLSEALLGLIDYLFSNPALSHALARPQCLGNLLLAAAIVQDNSSLEEITPSDVKNGVNFIAQLIGVEQDYVLPCTTTPCQLKMFYNNGVLITGEHKSAQARRGCPVDHAFVEFAASPQVLPEIFREIELADVIIFAPGSLYSSIVPVLQVPGVSSAIRENRKALKILVANIWAQAGETDIALDAPDRRYHVSDLIKAYQRNINNGITDLFQVVVSLGLRDIPGSIIQSYAVEGKTPIYLDRGKIWEMGLVPVEANIFSKQALADRTVKHDHIAFAKMLKALWWGRDSMEKPPEIEASDGLPVKVKYLVSGNGSACSRFHDVCLILKSKGFAEAELLSEIFWRHKDIPLEHLALVDGLELVDVDQWSRSQKWDNVFSFYDPDDRVIKICRNVLADPHKFEVAFLIALGQSLLGNYCCEKVLKPLEQEGIRLGSVYHIRLQDTTNLQAYFVKDDLEEYLELARMNQAKGDPDLFIRLLNGHEGFTPPGMLFGLIYAWYLDNLLASHVEYKMSITRMPISDLVPEQVRALTRRKATIKFFREKVFCQEMPG